MLLPFQTKVHNQYFFQVHQFYQPLLEEFLTPEKQIKAEFFLFQKGELAVELCDLIEKEFKPESVKIRLNKPKAVADAQSIGIEIYRNFGVENGN